MDYILGKLERNFKLISFGLIGISFFLQFQLSLLLIVLALMHSFGKDIVMYFEKKYRDVDNYGLDFYENYKFVLTTLFILISIFFEFTITFLFIAFILFVSAVKDGLFEKEVQEENLVLLLLIIPLIFFVFSLKLN